MYTHTPRVGRTRTVQAYMYTTEQFAEFYLFFFFSYFAGVYGERWKVLYINCQARGKKIGPINRKKKRKIEIGTLIKKAEIR